MGKERIIVICPGRGTYTRETSGYLANFGAPAKNQIASSGAGCLIPIFLKDCRCVKL